MGLAAVIFSNLLLFFLVFGMSATVEIGHMRRQLNNRRAFLTGLSMQFIILPFLGFLVVTMLRLDAPLGITLLVITSSPGGSYSNWCVSYTMTTCGIWISSEPSKSNTTWCFCTRLYLWNGRNKYLQLLRFLFIFILLSQVVFPLQRWLSSIRGNDGRFYNILCGHATTQFVNIFHYYLWRSRCCEGTGLGGIIYIVGYYNFSHYVRIIL